MQLSPPATPLIALLVQVGEGGYSFVYLVRELRSSQNPEAPAELYALKKASSCGSRFIVHVVRDLLTGIPFNHCMHRCGHDPRAGSFGQLENWLINMPATGAVICKGKHCKT